MIKRNRTSELVVKPRVSAHAKFMIFAVGVLLVLLAAGGIYRYGLSQGGFEFSIASLKQTRLENKVKNLEGENQELREQLARSERALQMNETTYKELDESLKTSAQEIVRLREEISFYRNILSPENKQPGVRIQSLHIEPTEKAAVFQYKLVVIQALKHDLQVRGSARFEISGLQAGKNTTLQFPGKQSRQIIVNFKYFQDIEGKFELPANFEPDLVKVVVQTSGREAKTLEREYNWPKLGAI
jgi:hypothetical protein